LRDLTLIDDMAAMTTTATPTNTGPKSLNSPNATPVLVVYVKVKTCPVMEQAPR